MGAFVDSEGSPTFLMHEDGLPLRVVETALLPGSLRRLIRPADAPRLSPIRSLAYLRPVIDELRAHPAPEGYLDYLRLKLRQAAAVKSRFLMSANNLERTGRQIVLAGQSHLLPTFESPSAKLGQRQLTIERTVAVPERAAKTRFSSIFV